MADVFSYNASMRAINYLHPLSYDFTIDYAATRKDMKHNFAMLNLGMDNLLRSIAVDDFQHATHQKKAAVGMHEAVAESGFYSDLVAGKGDACGARLFTDIFSTPCYRLSQLLV
jgi:hypothetical protein